MGAPHGGSAAAGEGAGPPAPGSSARGSPAVGTLTVLGCDGSYPGPRGAASGYLVEAGGAVLWLDAGPGTFANLQAEIDPGRVDAVVLSHEHPDHWSDIDPFALWLREHRRLRPVPVYAPPGLRARAYFGDDPVLSWHEVEPSSRIAVRPAGGTGTGVRCSFAATDHGPPTLATRVEPVGPSGVALPALAYSADTGPDWSVEELGAGIGLLLCEATFTQGHEGEGRHLSGRQAGAMAAASCVERLVVTHRRPSIAADALAAEASEAFGGPVDQAALGRRFSW